MVFLEYSYVHTIKYNNINKHFDFTLPNKDLAKIVLPLNLSTELPFNIIILMSLFYLYLQYIKLFVKIIKIVKKNHN